MTAVGLFILETEPQLKNHFSKTLDPSMHPSDTRPRCAFILFYLNAVIMLCFTVDIVARMLTWPTFASFWRDVFNVLDVVSILPFYIQVVELLLGQNREASSDIVVLRMLRVLRVLRIFKLVKHSKDLMIICKAVSSAGKELCVLTVLMVIFIVTFGSIMYYIEGPDDGFSSITASCWWVIVTVTTVGYGDMYPVSVWGKMFGGMVMVLGVVVVALPMTVIVNKFSLVYAENNPDKV